MPTNDQTAQSCYNCKNRELCFARYEFDATVIRCLKMFDDSVSDWQGIIAALARACIKFESNLTPNK